MQNGEAQHGQDVKAHGLYNLLIWQQYSRHEELRLAGMFHANFATYADDVSVAVRAAGSTSSDAD